MPPPAYRALKLCSNGGGFEALPLDSKPIDLPRVRVALERAGVAVVDARVMLIASLEPETTISRSGRLLFKTADERAARRALERFLALLGSTGPEPPRPASRPT